MREAFTFDDVVIAPKFSTVPSRKDVDLSVKTHYESFQDIGALRLPIISANMDTITGPEMAKAMLAYGAQACLHRFCTIEENIKMFERSYGSESDVWETRPMVSIGLGKHELERAEALYNKGAWRFVIDVANGASIAVVEQVRALRKIIDFDGSITVGNFATDESVKAFLEHLGGAVEGIKVGVGPGSACTTRVKTGIGYPQLSAILEISRLLKKTGISVIADGGMKAPGDVAKALAAGASLCMLGGMLAGTDETPGEALYVDGQGRYVKPEDFLATVDGKLFRDEYSESFKKVKKYRGSASKESYEVQGKVASHRAAEGEAFYVPYKGPVADILQDIEGGLRGSFSSVGARDLREFHAKAEFVRVTSAGYIEGTPHGKK